MKNALREMRKNIRSYYLISMFPYPTTISYFRKCI